MMTATTAAWTERTLGKSDPAKAGRPVARKGPFNETRRWKGIPVEKPKDAVMAALNGDDAMRILGNIEGEQRAVQKELRELKAEVRAMKSEVRSDTEALEQRAGKVEMQLVSIGTDLLKLNADVQNNKDGVREWRAFSSAGKGVRWFVAGVATLIGLASLDQIVSLVRWIKGG